jgi:uncharacterized protein (TIGR02271 family)
MAKTVVALMESPQEAENVVRDLTSTCGCDRSDIGMMARGSQQNDAEVSINETSGGEDRSTVASGALKGAGTGAAVGGILGLAAGAAALTIPGIGPFIAAGPIAAGLAGAGIGAAAGGAIGALVHLGVPEEEAHYYAEGVRRGGTLLTVNASTDEMATCAAMVMKNHGAADIEQRAAQWKEQGWGGKLTTGNEQDNEQEVLPVTQEELVVGKRQVSRGGVRVYSQVSETPVQENVQLREEHVQVERRPVDRPVEASDEVFQERSIELTEMAEEPVVSKRSRVTEEVRVGKQATQREQTVSDKVRKTDVRVEETGQGSSTGRHPPERRMNPSSSYSGGDRRMAR